MTTDDEYFAYLRRTRLGPVYRRRWVFPRLCRHLRGRVLDVGCGIGHMLRYRPDTVGVDVNANAVEWCRSQGLPARLMQSDVLPFSDAEFEGAVLDNVLEHLREPVPLLAEIRRVLVPDGVLVVGVPGRRGFASDPDHKVFYDESALVTTLTGAGFTLARLFHTPFRSAWLDERLRQYCVYGVFGRG